MTRNLATGRVYSSAGASPDRPFRSDRCQADLPPRATRIRSQTKADTIFANLRESTNAAFHRCAHRIYHAVIRCSSAASFRLNLHLLSLPGAAAIELCQVATWRAVWKTYTTTFAQRATTAAASAEKQVSCRCLPPLRRPPLHCAGLPARTRPDRQP